MRIGAPSLAIVIALLLMSPASALAQAEQYVDPLPVAREAAERPTTDAEPSDTAAAPAQTDTAPAQTETEEAPPPEDVPEEEAPEEESVPDEVPQYVDPLSHKQGGTSQDASGTAAVTASASAGGGLPTTGFSVGLLALVGLTLLGAGATIMRLSRGTSP